MGGGEKLENCHLLPLAYFRNWLSVRGLRLIAKHQK
jgi:hypothetical protein